MNLLRISKPLLPTPMQPVAIRLLGAFWPKTDAGTMVGAARATAAADFTKSRRLTLFCDTRDSANTLGGQCRASASSQTSDPLVVWWSFEPRHFSGSLLRRHELHGPQVDGLPT